MIYYRLPPQSRANGLKVFINSFGGLEKALYIAVKLETTNMDVKIYNKEKIRVYTQYANELFIDVKAEEGTLQTEVLESLSTMQVRRKGGFVKVFYFHPYTNLEDYDFGYYSDSEILFSNH